MTDIEREMLVALRDEYIEDQFNHLNNEQLKAVLNVTGPEIILAGAGSGKTTVLVNRIEHILKFGVAYKSTSLRPQAESISLLEQLIRWKNTGERLDKQCEDALSINKPAPWNIVAITFTNKAANELKDRIQKQIGEDNGKKVQAQTFHSLCQKILRIEHEAIGFPSHFTIYDSDDQKRVMKEVIHEVYGEAIDDGELTLDVKTAIEYIQRFKDNLMQTDYIEAKMQELDDQTYEYKYYSLYKPYQTELKLAKAMDFDDLVYQTVELFSNRPDILSKYQYKYKYIHVDEYQDTSKAQCTLVDLLAGYWKNICVVGDDDQSIYSFRGALVDNILNFDKRYEHTYSVKLEQNYRQTKNILGAANQVIKNNTKRTDKKLWTQSEDGQKVMIHQEEQSFDEAVWVADNIKALNDYKNTVVLYRNNSLSAMMEQEFIRQSIPYRIIGGVKFFDRKEVKDILAYLQILVNPEDNLRLKRIINVPARKIGKTTIDKIENIQKSKGISMLEVCRNSQSYRELQRQSKAIQGFINIYDKLHTDLDEIPLQDMIRNIYDTVGYNDVIEQKANAADALFNINQLESMADKYENKEDRDTSVVVQQGFLEEISLVQDLDNLNKSEDTVKMMTMHQSKGLEFQNVFLIGWIAGVFPQAIAVQNGNIEEERRLAYVGITRAKKRLYITFTNSQFAWGQYSRQSPQSFLFEIDKQYITGCDLGAYTKRLEDDKKVKAEKEARTLEMDESGHTGLDEKQCTNVKELPDIGDTLKDDSGIIYNVKNILKYGEVHLVFVESQAGQRQTMVWERQSLHII